MSLIFNLLLLGAQFCPPCRYTAWVAANGLRLGEPLWQGATPSVSLSALQRALLLTQVPSPSSYAWRAIRAGRATELASVPGVSIKDIMEAGQWSSAAVLKYVRPKDVDPQALMDMVLDASDDEAEE